MADNAPQSDGGAAAWQGCPRGCRPMLRGRLLEVAEDRAVGPVVARAGVRQRRERGDHVLHLGDPMPQLLDVLKSDALDIAALPAAVTPEVQELLDLGHREAQIARARRMKRSMWTSVSE